MLDSGLQRLDHRARSTLDSDGIRTLVNGLALLLMALFFYDHRHAWAFIVASAMHRSLPDALRRRITYPRVGYARFLPSLSRREASLLFAGLCVALALGGVLDNSPYRWLEPLYLGLLYAAVSVAAAGRVAAVWDYAFAALIALSGLVGLRWTSRGTDSNIVTGVQVALLGALLACVGVVQLVQFLRRHPRLSEQDPEATHDVRATC